MTNDQFETIFHRIQWTSVGDDGTIHIPASIYDETSVSTARLEIATDHAQYAFWCWLIAQKRYQRTLNEQDVEEAQAEFERRSREKN